MKLTLRYSITHFTHWAAGTAAVSFATLYLMNRGVSAGMAGTLLALSGLLSCISQPFLAAADFIAEKNGEKIYYQVAATILDPATYEREFAPLKAIPDNYPKYVLTLDEFSMGEDGINQKT